MLRRYTVAPSKQLSFARNQAIIRGFDQTAPSSDLAIQLQVASCGAVIATVLEERC